MLERPTNQAAGLIDFAMPPTPRLMAMVSHGDAQAELPLLLRICAALAGLGYTVMVLDGSVLETASNPGLEQVLNFSYAPPSHAESPSWSILPAGLGLQSLSAAHRHGGPGIVECGGFFPHESIIIAYATAQNLTPLLQDSQVRPLLAISGAKSSLVTSYLALKRLLLKAKVEPTVVNMVDSTTQKKSEGNLSTSLSDCAKYFLNYDIRPLSITAPATEDMASDSIERLALGLLESAMPLNASLAYTPHLTRQSFSTPLPVRRH